MSEVCACLNTEAELGVDEDIIDQPRQRGDRQEQFLSNDEN